MAMGEWDNIIEDDFKNPKFNSYLVEQPGANVEIFDDCRRSKIIIKHVHEQYSEKSIRNLCNEYGTVCSVQRGPTSNHYYFVIFGSPDEAQYAIEKINQLYKPMRAEFAKSREEKLPKLDPMKLLLQNTSFDDCPINTNRIFRGPFIQNQPFIFPEHEIPLTEREYREKLGAIDESLNFFNESAFCDFLIHPDDIKLLEEEVLNYHLKDSIWVFKPNPKELELIRKKATTSFGAYDSLHEVHIKSHSDFKALSEKLGKCKMCNKLTTRQTKKTSIYFCSSKCQDDNDFVGEEIPKLQSEKLQLIEVMNGINVVITCIINQNTVYVRPCDMRNTAAYYKQLQFISALSQTATYLMKILPKPGDLVAVCIEEDIYLRAMVLKFIDREHIRVAFLDTGAVSIQKLCNFRKLLPELRDLPIYVSKVKLKGVSNDYISLKTLEYMTKYVHSEPQREVEIKFDTETDEVRLYDHNECLNDDLIELVNLSVAEDTDNNKDITYSYMPTRTELELIIVDNSLLIHGQISCILKNSVFKLEQIHSKIQCYGKKLKDIKVYTPRISELCVVYIGGHWYRGICEEAVGDQHPTICCYDFGFWSLVNNKNIAPMPDCLLDTCYTHVCLIDGFEPENFTKQQMEAIRQKILPNSIIKVDKLIHRNGAYVIHSDEIREIISKIESEIPKPLNGTIANLSFNMSQNGNAINESNEDEVD